MAKAKEETKRDTVPQSFRLDGELVDLITVLRGQTRYHPTFTQVVEEALWEHLAAHGSDDAKKIARQRLADSASRK